MPNKDNSKLPAGDEELASVQAVRKTGRGGKFNFPNAIPPEDADDVKQALSAVLQWYDIGKTRPADAEEWEERQDLFFSTCITQGQRPTWEKYCLCMGYPRQMIWDFANGNRNASPAISDLIKKAKDYCAAYDAEMVTTGKLRDAPYIFRAVNYYGLRQPQDVRLEVATTQLSADQPEDIATKYKELPD